MLNINTIYNFLCEDQVKIDSNYYSKINYFEKNKIEYKLDKDELDLPDCLNFIFNNNINDYYYVNINNNKILIFTLINSIFNIGNSIFNLYDNSIQNIIIYKFIKKIDNDLFKKGYFNKFKYGNYITPSDFQNLLLNINNYEENEINNIFKKYLSDYLGINIYIIKINNQQIDYDRCEYYLTEQFNNINKYVPNMVILYENNIYKPILMHNNKDSSILLYSKNKNIIDNIWDYLKINDKLLSKHISDSNPESESNSNSDSNPDSKSDSNLDNKSDSNLDNKSDSNLDSNLDSKIKNELDTKPEKLVSTILNKKYEYNFLKNLKIDFIKTLCQENNIELLKKSDKTSKMINKIKKDLIDDLLIIVI